MRFKGPPQIYYNPVIQQALKYSNIIPVLPVEFKIHEVGKGKREKERKHS